MFLRNWYNLLLGTWLYSGSTDTTTFGDGHINFKTYSGTIFAGNLTNMQGANSICYPRIIAEQGSYGVSMIFGSGTTQVTFDDYKLESIITSLSPSNWQYGSVSYDSTTNKYSKSISVILSNNTTSDITVSEVGLGVKAAAPDNNFALAAREVLSTPFTIAAGESVTYTHNFEFTMPTIS